MYSIGQDGSLTELVETPYELELHLQRLIATHAPLLAGEQMDRSAPRRFVFVGEEIGVRTSENSGDSYYIDLVFLDQDAILTLVEVKRSSDTRIRREVIGQLLEYASNTAAFTSADQIRSIYENTAIKSGYNAITYLEEKLSIETGRYENYWQQLEGTLLKEQFRLVLVADKIPLDTLRIIEYLNRQMTGTEVFAVTVSQFSGGGTKTLSPLLLNPSQREAQRKSSSARSEQWTSERFYEALDSTEPPEAATIFRKIEHWANQAANVDFDFGDGAYLGSIQIYYKATMDLARYERRSDVVFLTLRTNGTIEFGLMYLNRSSRFSSHEAIAEELISKLNDLGFEISQKVLSGKPNRSWTTLQVEGRLAKFLELQDWTVSVLRGY